MARYALLLLAAMAMVGLMTLARAGDEPAATSPPPPPPADRTWGDGPPPHHEAMRGEGPQVELTPQQIEETIEVMRDMTPWLAERLEEARKENPQKVEGVIRRFFPRYREFLELKRHDPELYELRIKEIRLDMESRKLAWRIRQAEQPASPPPPEDANKRQPPSPEVNQEQSPKQAPPPESATPEELREQLRGVLDELFDLHRQTRQHEIDMLKKRVKELEASLDESRDKREQLIDKRVEELLDQAERGPRWWQRGEGGPPDRPGEPGERRERGPDDRQPFMPGQRGPYPNPAPPPADGSPSAPPA
ncbi:MAG: hypothetical protein IT445_15390 [Phycisphaeraceae bacterium]|nr:hypothetical protein [Phycisphaeraceae bacterium]